MSKFAKKSGTGGSGKAYGGKGGSKSFNKGKEYVPSMKDGYHSFLADSLKLPFRVKLDLDLIDISELITKLQDTLDKGGEKPATLTLNGLLKLVLGVTEDAGVDNALDYLVTDEKECNTFSYLLNAFNKSTTYMTSEASAKFKQANLEFIAFAAEKFDVKINE